ncbi:MAG: sensor histidine kinase [Lachnotalea sp.]
MNKLKYSNGIRIIAFVLMELLILAATISALYLGSANISTDYFKEIIAGKSYIDSQYFSNQLITNINNANRFVECQQDLEVAGEFNANQEVTISQFLSDDSNASQYSIQQSYKLQDLIDWSQESIEVGSIVGVIRARQSSTLTNDRINYSESADTDSSTNTQVEAYPELSNDENIEIVGDAGTTDEELLDELKKSGINLTSEQMKTSIIKERYVTSNGITMLENAIYNNDFSEIIKTSEEIQEALENIKLEYSFYKENETYYKSLDSSNFKIYIQDYKGDVILNNCVDSDTSYEQYFSNNVSGGIIYNATNNEFNFTEGINDAAYSNIESFKVPNQINYIYAAGIDGEYAHNDVFSDGYKVYHNVKVSTIILLCGMLGILICFIYLVSVSGRNTSDEELHLNGFDKIKTEIGAAIMVALAIAVIFISYTIIESISYYIVIVAWMEIETSLFTLGFLSLVKRIKAGEIWKNSLFYSAVKWIALFLKYKKETTKVVIIYLAYSVVTLGLLDVVVSSGSFLVLCVWFVFAGTVGLILLKEAIARQSILNGIKKITNGELNHKIDTANLKGSNIVLAYAINNIGEGLHNAVDASMRNERLKTDLITNVSHDIKTPLTSIINYVDLIKREDIKDEKIKGYVEILDNKSQRLKNLTEDLVEASKISSGNIKLEMTKINFVELINQTEGEFSGKFAAKRLLVVKTIPKDPVNIQADGRRIWRVIENLYNNVAKYAMENTRVYMDVIAYEDKVEFSIKNISESPLNINADELTERFIRGDVSRSTEGSGLGLSIAKNLTTLQKGTFEIYLDGDLFRVTITFPRV